MLAFSRNYGESFQIGDDIIVHIVEPRCGGVQVSVKAPKHIRILRSEVASRMASQDSQSQHQKQPMPTESILSPLASRVAARRKALELQESAT